MQRRPECDVPARWDVEGTMVLNPIWKHERNKKVVQIHHNLKEHDTDSDAR